MNSCRSCGATVVPAVVASSGKYMPLDPKAQPSGNIAREGGLRAGAILVRVLKKGETHPDPMRFVSHFATCPHAPQWRKPTRKASR